MFPVGFAAWAWAAPGPRDPESSAGWSRLVYGHPLQPPAPAHQQGTDNRRHVGHEPSGHSSAGRLAAKQGATVLDIHGAGDGSPRPRCQRAGMQSDPVSHDRAAWAEARDSQPGGHEASAPPGHQYKAFENPWRERWGRQCSYSSLYSPMREGAIPAAARTCPPPQRCGAPALVPPRGEGSPRRLTTGQGPRDLLWSQCRVVPQGKRLNGACSRAPERALERTPGIGLLPSWNGVWAQPHSAGLALHLQRLPQQGPCPDGAHWTPPPTFSLV